MYLHSIAHPNTCEWLLEQLRVLATILVARCQVLWGSIFAVCSNAGLQTHYGKEKCRMLVLWAVYGLVSSWTPCTLGLFRFYSRSGGASSSRVLGFLQMFFERLAGFVYATISISTGGPLGNEPLRYSYRVGQFRPKTPNQCLAEKCVYVAFHLRPYSLYISHVVETKTASREEFLIDCITRRGTEPSQKKSKTCPFTSLSFSFLFSTLMSADKRCQFVFLLKAIFSTHSMWWATCLPFPCHRGMKKLSTANFYRSLRDCLQCRIGHKEFPIYGRDPLIVLCVPRIREFRSKKIWPPSLISRSLRFHRKTAS